MAQCGECAKVKEYMLHEHPQGKCTRCLHFKDCLTKCGQHKLGNEIIIMSHQHEFCSKFNKSDQLSCYTCNSYIINLLGKYQNEMENR